MSFSAEQVRLGLLAAIAALLLALNVQFFMTFSSERIFKVTDVSRSVRTAEAPSADEIADEVERKLPSAREIQMAVKDAVGECTISGNVNEFGGGGYVIADINCR
jgi:hypothetical protein